MGIIRPLDEHLANQIAAGEVVERPASVLKELVENAVDAGANRIDIAAEDGGLAMIRVQDNGSGIQPDDMLLAFQRHATSKISSAKDLFRIQTLGFRGEALPSIAAVSKVRCVSSSDDSGLGRFVEIAGGAIVAEGETSAPRGTVMTVKDLFYNTPARLKYMKTIQTELGHLSDMVYRQALARPDIAFSFRHNGNMLLKTAGTGDLRQVAAAIYGTASAKAMAELSAEHPDYTLTGLVALPEETRASRSAITVLVNGRYVRSPAVLQALLAAYHTLLPVGRYPLAILHLRMHPSLVDVNVHPAKLEVRFSKEQELKNFVEEAVKETLSRHVSVPSGYRARAVKSQPAWVQDRIRFPLPPAAPDAGVTNASPYVAESAAPPFRAPESAAASGGAGAIAHPSGRSFAPETAKRTLPETAEGKGAGAFRAAPAKAADAAAIPGEVWEAAYAAPENAAAESAGFPELTWIGQFHGTYIIAQNENGLYLIDQHAAHERINYEHYYDKFGRPNEASQELLLPVPLEFTPDAFAVLKERLPMFSSVGVYLEEFGGNTFIIRAVPHWFPKGEEAGIVREMAEWVLAERKVDLPALRDKAAMLVSCKASIKANEPLTREAAETLLKRLSACRMPYTCPHGRPVIVSFSKYEIEKMFKRVMP